MTDAVLTLNAGSSSVKFTLFAAEAEMTRKSAICDGEVEGLGDAAHFIVKDSGGATLIDERLDEPATHENALQALLRWFEG